MHMYLCISKNITAFQITSLLSHPYLLKIHFNTTKFRRDYRTITTTQPMLNQLHHTQLVKLSIISNRISFRWWDRSFKKFCLITYKHKPLTRVMGIWKIHIWVQMPAKLLILNKYLFSRPKMLRNYLELVNLTFFQNRRVSKLQIG